MEEKEALGEELIEYCVRCGATTHYKKTDNITYRSGYIEGMGQLCFKCTQTRKMHKQGAYEWWGITWPESTGER